MNSLIFFGNEQIATGINTDAIVLQSLIESGYAVKAVVCNKESIVSRKSKELQVEQIAAKNNIPFLSPKKIKDIENELKSYAADVGILIAYGQIIPESIISLFPARIVNIHPSLLPLHRGSTPIESVILAGEDVTGVSIMSLAKKMDAGPVYGQRRVVLDKTETKKNLAKKLLSLGNELLLELLPQILHGSLKPQPQDESQATYDTLITKKDGVIDYTKEADQIEREIRAFAEWPKSTTTLGGLDVIITGAHAVPSANLSQEPGDIEVVNKNLLMITCANQTSLCIDTLKPAGKKEMPIQAFLNGAGSRLT